MSGHPGRPRCLTPEEERIFAQMRRDRVPVRKACAYFDITRATYYDYCLRLGLPVQPQPTPRPSLSDHVAKLDLAAACCRRTCEWCGHRTDPAVEHRCGPLRWWNTGRLFDVSEEAA